MNRSARCCYWCTILMLIFFLACRNGSGEKDSTLNARPYAPLTDSIEKFPKLARLYLQRALLLSQHNEHDLATADFAKAWELEPNEITGLQYATNLQLTDRAHDAIKLLAACEKKYPNNPEFGRRLSELYSLAGETGEALQKYDQILQHDSMNFEAWYEKGLLLSRMGDTAAALQAMEKSFAIQPINYTGLALANLYEANLNPRTLAICDILIQRDSTHEQTDAVFLKGTYYSDTRQYAKAIENFDECIRRDWKMTDAYIEKGIILYEQNQYDSALRVFSLASTVSNTLADAWYWMARCYEKKGDKDNAVANYERAIALDRNFAEARQRLKNLQ